MRVATRGRTTRPGGEDGATTVIFAICLFALFGVAALAVDAGQLWWNRRSLVVDTDAAALAAAGHARERMVLTGLCDVAGAADVADLLITENDATTSFDKTDPTQFDLDCTAGSRYGHVIVSATNETRYAFAGIFGRGDRTDVYARSHAEFGPLVAAEKLRPLPLCLGVDEAGNRTAYSAWTDGDRSAPPYIGESVSGPIYEVRISRDYFAGVCNDDEWGTAGEFKWVDFDGKASEHTSCSEEKWTDGKNALAERFDRGYECLVYSHQYASGHNCKPDGDGPFTNDYCGSESGFVSSVFQCVNGGTGCDRQVCPPDTPAKACEHIWVLLVYDHLIGVRNGVECTGDATDPANSSCQPEFHPLGFVSAVLRKAEKDPKGPEGSMWLEFIGDATGQGVIGGPGVDASNLNITGVRLCGAEDVENCKG